MLDIHCHILPGVDDGPKELSESLELARLLLLEGISYCVATPHFQVGMYEIGKQRVQELVIWLNKKLAENKIDLKVYPGMEISFSPEILSLLDREEICGINDSRYLLIESPQVTTPENINQLIFRLRLQGYVPVIAHPERSPLLQDNPDLTLQLINKGCLFQLNASSLVSENKPRETECAQRLIHSKAAHILASDAHSCDNRPPKLLHAFERACFLTGSREDAYNMVSRIPEYIISDQIYHPPEPRTVAKQNKGWKRFVPFLKF